MQATGGRQALARRVETAAPLVATLALWLILRPYSGFVGDGRLYLGQALAALDPGGVGKDFLFTGPGQFEFTVFPLLARSLVAAVGLSAASLLLSLVGIVLWFAALTVLCRRLAAGGGGWLLVAAAVLLPGLYDGVNAFHYGEAAATPRVFAEAFCLFALALLLDRRLVLALAMLALGGCFHPLMALGAAGVGAVYLCLADRRWLWLLIAGAAALGAAVWLRLPLADRLLVEAPPHWRAIIWDRSENILVSHWPAAFWSALAIHAATIALAAPRAARPAQRLLWAALIVGPIGLLVALLLGDEAARLLVLQLQTWRALWLTTLAANLALGVLALDRKAERGASLGLAALVLAWALSDLPAVGFMALAVAVPLILLERAGRLKPPPVMAAALWSVTVLLIVGRAVIVGAACIALVAGRPQGASLPPQVWQAPAAILALAALVAAIFHERWAGLDRRWLSAGAVLLLLLAVVVWDQRSAAQREVETGRTAASLKPLFAARPGEVLWVQGDVEPWIWLGRPSWVSSMHGAGVVFSPTLAGTWNERSLRAMQAGLMSPETRTPFRTTPARPFDPGLAQVQAFCAAADAPAWIVAPDLKPSSPLRALATGEWRPPAPTQQPSYAGLMLAWRGGREFFIIPCAGMTKSAR